MIKEFFSNIFALIHVLQHDKDGDDTDLLKKYPTNKDALEGFGFPFFILLLTAVITTIGGSWSLIQSLIPLPEYQNVDWRDTGESVVFLLLGLTGVHYFVLAYRFIRQLLHAPDAQDYKDRSHHQLPKLRQEIEEANSKIADLTSRLEQQLSKLTDCEKSLKTAQDEASRKDVEVLALKEHQIDLVSVKKKLDQELSSMQHAKAGDMKANHLMSELVKRLHDRDLDEYKDGLHSFVGKVLEVYPELTEKTKALAYASEEHKRINQYDTIIQLYNEKIAKVRAQDMDEEERDDAIAHWKRLRDTEIEELTRASDV